MYVLFFRTFTVKLTPTFGRSTTILGLRKRPEYQFQRIRPERGPKRKKHAE
jgi:hypothetical protein